MARVSALTLPSAVGVRLTGIDDAGRSPGAVVEVELAAGAAVVHDVFALESGDGLDGHLGDGAGKWRLAAEAVRGVVAMSLMESPSGHLTNLSTAPINRHDGALVVPLFLSAADPWQRQGLVRVVNRTGEAGTVQIKPFDDSTWNYDPLELRIGPSAAAHFDSHDLEIGNPRKALTGSTGAATKGNWWLRLTSDVEIDALAYARHPDGFLTSMHDVAPLRHGAHHVPTFNPASNHQQASHLRILNPSMKPAKVRITGIDSTGTSPGSDVVVQVPPHRSLTLDAPTLEQGAPTLQGALGDGTSKWRLHIISDQPILVMSLMQSPTGHLTNLTSRTTRAD